MYVCKWINRRYMNINDKIKQILIDKNLTPSYFADEIGVQRSSISHILSGRNRPSFDIIQKIIRRFPELGYEWIMEEETQLPNQPRQAVGYGVQRSTQPSAVDQRERFIGQPQPSISYTTPSVSTRTQRTEIAPVVQQPYASSVETSSGNVEPPLISISEKKVEKILIFYTDGSFREYSPSL